MNTSARMLRLLSLLQTHRYWPGSELSDRLEVSPRTLRRDIDRLRELGLEHTVVPAAGTSQDVAMLLASEKGASLIVSVGAHLNLTEFLDKQRSGMSSTFLTRLRVGETLVDAKGVSRLYRSRISSLSLLLLVLGAVVAMVAAVYVSQAGRLYSTLVEDEWRDFTFWLSELL